MPFPGEMSILNVFDVVSGEFSLTMLVALVLILGLSAIMSGLSGFGFSAIGALCLWLLPPFLRSCSSLS